MRNSEQDQTVKTWFLFTIIGQRSNKQHHTRTGQLANKASVPAKSLLNEILNILGIRHNENTNISLLRIAVKNRLELINIEENNLEQKSKSICIRYLLENRTKENEETLNALIDNFPNRISNKNSTRKTSQNHKINNLN